MILTIRTDQPQAEIGLYDNQQQLAYHAWLAHRQLAETIHTKLQMLLAEQHKNWSDVSGIVVFQGPGSFTGLRIGISVANALAYGLQIPMVGAQGSNWLNDGIKKLTNQPVSQIVLPEYGAPVHITAPKK